MPIFNQGYQHWQGQLSGHLWRWLVITRHGIQAGMKNRNTRFFLLLAWLPALVLVAFLSIWGLFEQAADIVKPFIQMLPFISREMVANPVQYRGDVWTIAYSYFLLTELRLSMLLILLVGPSLISQDLRFNAIPLYLSRPLKRIDYFMGKLGVIVGFLGMVIIVPAIVAYVFGLLFSLDISIIGDTYRVLLASLGFGALIALSAGLFILALSSLSRNSRYVALFWLGIWFVTSLTAGALSGFDETSRFNEFAAEKAETQRKSAQGWRARYDLRISPEWQAANAEASKTDWRPLISYTTNLARVGREMLGTDAAAAGIFQMPEGGARDAFVLARVGPLYPWYWSAGIIVGLLGISICILQMRIRSLDRLR